MLFSKNKTYKNTIGDTVKITQFNTPIPDAFYVKNLDGFEVGSVYIELEPHSLKELISS
jgi:hypothetical protein